ncbi:MAG: ABC transporter ATP-binding protein [Planctomycetes bacterium]|nr:ABC transporter ATP-binding protein [Planctomycetota bacterium]
MEIEFKRVSKRFGAISAVKDLNIKTPPRKLTALLGPSGSGKSTVLSLIAGLTTPDEGEIWMNGRIVSGPGRIIVPPEKREIGMVFQTLALWPHMTAKDNIRFVLKGRCTKEEADRKADEILAMADIGRYAGTFPGAMSGGERQRLALARALVARPKFLLLDEPLINLDRYLVKKLIGEIKAFHEKFETTTVYVTHDYTEAAALADGIAIIRDGKLVQAGTFAEIIAHPADSFVSDFINDSRLNESGR